jgi:hypothetical protein
MPCNDLNLFPARWKSLLQLCECCVNDAGFQSGMAGASRCELIEQATIQACTGAGYPAEWRLGSDGMLSCLAFTPDF